PDTGEVTVTPKKPDGKLYPENTKVEIPGKDKDHPITITIGKDGKGKVPNSELPEEKVPGTSKITVPGKPSVEVPKVTTPAKVTPETPVTEKPGKIEITQQPNGNAIVTPKKPNGTTYPSGSKVEIPGENGTTITVTIGDNGSGEVPNDKLPKDAKPGTGTVTEPNKRPSQPVDVTTPARKTPTVELEQDPKTGDVIVTPQRPGGGTYPPGTTVEIPGEDGPITVEIGQDGKGKVPNDKLPKKAVPGTGKITEPNKPSVEVPKVTTPGKVTPATPVTEKPGKIEITQQPNGNAIVTPKKPDGTTYPSGSKVEIPGENGTTITVTIGDNGSGEVPNDKLPKDAKPGTGTVTEPNKRPSQPVDVTTPARKTPTVELEQDPKTGDVIVTPQRPGGGTYPPGTTVEIPGKDKDHPITITIGKDGKGKVPNNELPEGKVPGTSKITVPGKPAVEVPVETPARKTPTVDVEQDPKTGDVTVTPKKPDGSTYPPGTKVEIPGKDGNPITVTIGEDGKGKVPNSELPDGKVPGTAKITEPGKPTVEVPVETPAKVIAENGELPGPITLPELTIEVRWIDENGNVLKPSVETGNEKDAEHGTIPGYEFVRTMIDENEPVMTHIFRKVSGTTNTNPVAPVTPATPVKPDTNGGSGQDTPAPTPAPTTPIPDAVTPNADQVDTQTTVDNGANSNDSQNVLPNTGTESNAALASLGLLGLLSGFGLVARKKKED
ncbi:hypothetical protein CYK18_10245, partial [Streptococcus mitis]